MAEAKTYETVEISMPGQEDIEFEGHEVAVASTWEHQGSNNNRWNEIHIYETTGGKYVVVDLYVTLWQGEKGSKTIEVFADRDSLRTYALGAGGLIVDAVKEAGIKLVRRID